MVKVYENIEVLRKQIPAGVKLVVVSKTQPVERIVEAYNAGQKIFGENRVQEITQKFPVLPDDIEWHFIGHLQTNKVRSLAPFVHTIHSIDSLRLLCEVDKEARSNNRKIACLLQFHIATEETKYGLDLAGARELLSSTEYKGMKNAEIHGLMGMATFTNDKALVRKEFASLKGCFNILSEEFFPGNKKFSEISMGMSGDYQIAIEEGSTMLRIGSLVFRNQDC